MSKAEFIFTPGIWLGEGKITLATSPECLKFYTKWEIKEGVAGSLRAIQVVEMEGMDERVFNSFTFKNILPVSFNLETAVQDDKVMQDFELESLTIGGEHSQKVKAPPIVSGYSSKDCVNLSSSTTVFRFNLVLENHFVGAVTGQGVRDHHTIAWEFHSQSNFEGFETYKRQENGDYFLHAEYGGSDQYRTTIEGLIWSKSS